MRPTKGEIGNARIGCGNGLVKTEEQGQVTVDAFALENLGGLDALPGGRDLDQDALTADACRVIQCDDAVRLLDGGIGVVGEPRVHLSGNAPGNDGQDLFAEGDGQPLESKIRDFLLVRAFAQLVARVLQHAIHNGLILRHLRRGGNQRGVGGGVLRTKLLHRFNVAGVGNHNSVLAQLFKQILGHCSSWEGDSRPCDPRQ
jgi:hypothetical protein